MSSNVVTNHPNRKHSDFFLTIPDRHTPVLTANARVHNENHKIHSPIERLKPTRGKLTLTDLALVFLLHDNSEFPGSLVVPVESLRVFHGLHKFLPKVLDLLVRRVPDFGANKLRRHCVFVHQHLRVRWTNVQGPCRLREGLTCSGSEVLRIFGDRVPPLGCCTSSPFQFWPHHLLAIFQGLTKLSSGVERSSAGASSVGKKSARALLQGRPFGPVEALEKRSVLESRHRSPRSFAPYKSEFCEEFLAHAIIITPASPQRLHCLNLHA